MSSRRQEWTKQPTTEIKILQTDGKQYLAEQLAQENRELKQSIAQLKLQIQSLNAANAELRQEKQQLENTYDILLDKYERISGQQNNIDETNQNQDPSNNGVNNAANADNNQQQGTDGQYRQKYLQLQQQVNSLTQMLGYVKKQNLTLQQQCQRLTKRQVNYDQVYREVVRLKKDNQLKDQQIQYLNNVIKANHVEINYDQDFMLEMSATVIRNNNRPHDHQFQLGDPYSKPDLSKLETNFDEQAAQQDNSNITEVQKPEQSQLSRNKNQNIHEVKESRNNLQQTTSPIIEPVSPRKSINLSIEELIKLVNFYFGKLDSRAKKFKAMCRLRSNLQGIDF